MRTDRTDPAETFADRTKALLRKSRHPPCQLERLAPLRLPGRVKSREQALFPQCVVNLRHHQPLSLLGAKRL